MKTKILYHRNRSKILSENHRNRSKMDTPNTHIHDLSLFMALYNLNCCHGRLRHGLFPQEYVINNLEFFRFHLFFRQPNVVFVN